MKIDLLFSFNFNEFYVFVLLLKYVRTTVSYVLASNKMNQNSVFREISYYYLHFYCGVKLFLFLCSPIKYVALLWNICYIYLSKMEKVLKVDNILRIYILSLKWILHEHLLIYHLNFTYSFYFYFNK